MNLYILSYNNYYNRIVKKEETLEDYLPFVIYGPVQGVYGFTPGDGVNTVQVLGSNVQMYDGQGDYLLAVDENNEIDSRWFIIDTKRERSGQWTLTLHRDLVVDFYDKVLESPMFIEKATLNFDDPLIFNNENMTVNQIKMSETLLKDKSNCPWLIGYYIKSTDQELVANIPVDEGFSYIISDDITNEDWYSYVNTPGIYVNQMNLEVNVSGDSDLFQAYIRYGFNRNNFLFNQFDLHSMPFSRYETSDLDLTRDEVLTALNSDIPAINVQINNQFNLLGRDEIDRLESLTYQPIYDRATGLYYQVSLTRTNQTSSSYKYLGDGTLRVYLNNLVLGTDSVTDRGAGSVSNGFRYNFAESTAYQIRLLSFSVEQLSASINETQALKTKNSPYNIFAIPYGEINVINGEEEFITNKDISIRVMSEFIKNYSGATPILLDAQLMPYCPYQSLIESGEIDLTGIDTTSYSFITSGTGDSIRNVGIILNCPTARFDFVFNHEIVINNSKIQNECDLYRLCSPNWNGAFDFSAAKNNGVDYFNIECEYKPYTPYIHVAPNFKNLYGNREGDAMGLICGGDFGLPMTSSAWESYERQNKNFQNIFDRQIQNMEVQQKVGRIQDIVGGITGTVSGAVGGALAGSIIPSVGTATGLGAGGIASAIGGIADYAINEMLRNEAIDYTKDQFGYQLGNIQALPHTLTKVSSFNNNNKIFPFLEYYTCKDREKEALANKVAWNGMTVMTIGKIKDYIDNTWSYTVNDETIESKGYIKGQLINLSGTNDDYHVINSLANELYKGVYFKWE